jgi:CheY-like chemotaxis protein
MPEDAQRGTILLVDDNAAILGLAKRLLEMAGYAVITATDGREGLRFYAEHQSNIILLLTDVSMPNMGGLELADHLLGIDSKLPVVFMSGDAWSAHRGLECLAKPFRPGELFEVVNRAVHRNDSLAARGKNGSLTVAVL